MILWQDTEDVLLRNKLFFAARIYLKELKSLEIRFCFTISQHQKIEKTCNENLFLLIKFYRLENLSIV